MAWDMSGNNDEKSTFKRLIGMRVKNTGGIKMIYISCMVMVCSIVIVLIYRHQTVKTFEGLNSMIDGILENTFDEKVFDESRFSALESKLAHYLLASQVSSRNVVQEREKIKGLITDPCVRYFASDQNTHIQHFAIQRNANGGQPAGRRPAKPGSTASAGGKAEFLDCLTRKTFKA
jgi:hypothetical protein